MSNNNGGYMKKYDKLFESGNKAQFEKLIEKEDYKSGFETIPIRYGIERIKQELDELENALNEYDPFCTDCKVKNEWYNELRLEAADIANFAHMIILKCDKIIKQE